jgi:hypothetical protein
MLAAACLRGVVLGDWHSDSGVNGFNDENAEFFRVVIGLGFFLVCILVHGSVHFS